MTTDPSAVPPGRTDPPGELALVLHTHLPYLRNHGVWPVGEEWLFQAWGTSWLPVTQLLEEFADEGRTEVLTLGVTPTVAHQVADRRLARDLGTWLGGQVWRSEEQRWQRHLDPRVCALSSFFWRRFQRLADYHENVQRRGGLLAIWADLARRDVVELLGGPATHPYLPLLSDPALIDAQLTVGLDHHARWAGARPTGLWAPEMGYRPRARVADATATPRSVDADGNPKLPRTGPVLQGLEEHYAAHGIDHVLVDASTLVRAAGGRDRDWTARPAVPDPGTGHPDEVVRDGVRIGGSDVTAFGRDLSMAYHVWSPTGSYPGSAWYRDSYATGSFGCHPSWRVTDHASHPDDKAVYEPEAADTQVIRDVDHLHGVLREILDPRPGELVVAAFDTELFGHWWFEGVDFLAGLLRRVADDPRLRTTTTASRSTRRPASRRLALPESSWGFGKGHASWVTAETRPMWQTLRAAESRARASLAGGAASSAARNQVARELALLASSDWAYMVGRGSSPGYAAERVASHASALHALCDAIDADAPTDRLVTEFYRRDDAPADPTALVRALDPAAR